MSNRQKAGIFVFGLFGFIIGLSPFLPGIMYDLDLRDTYQAITWDGYARIGLGFFFVFGARYFNGIAAGFAQFLKEIIKRFTTKVS